MCYLENKSRMSDRILGLKTESLEWNRQCNELALDVKWGRAPFRKMRDHLDLMESLEPHGDLPNSQTNEARRILGLID